ncbi:cobalamin biosynthesis protein CbiG [Leptolyngbyaceae cyanobacterium JSC-12]|nr:cobalamin biosynthesis protein CbiG [Leptolyngbyaceae cyanobacterium JSC-12]
MLQHFQPIAAIATTLIGAHHLLPFIQSQSITLWVPPLVTSIAGAQTYSGSLKEHIQTLWASHRSLVFCLATDAVVRLIAPLLPDKATDPAVVVVDETGQFVIPVCGGHQRRADQLARLIAVSIEATPVLRGVANRAQLPGIDVLGIPFGWVKGEGNWTGVSAAISRGELVQVSQEAGSDLWWKGLPLEHPFRIGESHGAQVWIGPTRQTPDDKVPMVQWHPRVLWVGVGCERGAPKVVIEQAVQTVFRDYRLAEAAIAGIATLDLKADEAGLLAFCQERHLPLRCFSAADLRSVTVPNPSQIVEAKVGTPSVAEAAAILASQSPSPIPLAHSPLLNAPISPLRVPKQIFRLPDQPGAVTIAVAQAAQEYTGH